MSRSAPLVAIAALLALAACGSSETGPLFDGGGGAAATASSAGGGGGGGAPPACDDPASGPCEACLDASCCGAKVACNEGTPCAALAACAESAGCFDDPDFDACATAACPDEATVSAMDALHALAACSNASCAASCGA